MLGNKNRKNKTVIGGVGIALLLCVLMVGMTMTGLVQSETPEGATNLVAADDGIEDDMFALPEVYEQEELEYDPSSELEGMRSLNEKGYLLDNGDTVKIVGSEPVHYMGDEGSWEEIDLNLKATLNGWEVTENNFRVYFPSEAGLGVAIQVHENIDPIVTGINPTVTVIHDDVNPMPIPYENTGDSLETISVGGNVIRYPIAAGFDLDYAVGKTDVKQNLIIRDKPVLEEGIAWFGLTEEIRLPSGYGLYSGNQLVTEEVTITQDELAVRHLDTGEILVTIPAPQVMESGEISEPYIGTYFVQAFGANIVITTAVEGDWLMDEDRQFPLAIDPTMNVLSSAGGSCYYYAYCYSSTYRYFQRYSWAQMYRFNWQKYSFPTSTALGSSATISKIDYRFYIRYWYGSTSNNPDISVMENCGYQYHTSYNNIPSRSCSGVFPSSRLGTTGSYSYNGMMMKMSAWNSQSVVKQGTGAGWKTVTFCNSATACSAGGSAYVTSAAKAGGDIGISSRHKGTGSFYYYFYTYGSYNSYLQLTYSGVTDSKAPTMENPAYSGITSYKEGSRTIFAKLTDFTGIDTTTAGAPHLYYSVNNSSYTSVKATTIGTCSGSSARDCSFKAETSDLSAGDYVNYFWAYRDTSTNANAATSPSGGTGTSPSSITTAPSTTSWFFIDTPENAPFAENKLTVAMTKVSAYPTTSPRQTFDRQMTYYEDSKEYVFEFDTSRCGTGSSSCFYTYASTFYSNWRLMWTTAPAYTSWGYGGTLKGLNMLSSLDGGFLPISADDGPGMNIAFLYDTTEDDWAMIGIGDETTGIEQALTSGTSPSYDRSYGYSYSYSSLIPGNITGTFGEFDWNGTSYSSSRANWMCMGSNGVIQFFRYSMTANPTCNTGYWYLYRTSSYKWNGWAIASGYYGVQASGGKMLMKVSNVKPLPDTTAPDVKHNGLSDSHSRDRTITAKIIDGGDPPSGVNTTATIGVGPTLYYRITDANGTVGSWTSTLLNVESGKTRTQCETAECSWSYELQDIERGAEVDYYIKTQDLSTAPGGVNVNTTSTYNFEVGDPNKMFVIEWHDMGYTSTYTCTYQAVMYDVTNEIEFKYDSGCRVLYDYGTVGYQDKTRTHGATIDSEDGYLAGANAFDTNYRIGTSSSTDHSWETFDLGLTELPTYDTVLRGTSSGSYYSFYCGYSYYFNRNPYTAACAANVALPSGFAFEYFGNEYNGSASTPDRVNIARHGAFNLIDNGASSPQQLLYYAWYSNTPDLPYKSGTGSSYVRPALLAPWFGYYSSYYCYDNSNLDCSIRTRVIPFEGKGTDVSSDITVPTTWSKIDSPIRVNPSSSSGYLTVSADLTIEPGVEIQVGQGKGISIDGACTQLVAEGNSTDHIEFTGQNNGTWLGLAFTGACSTSTDDRHVLSYVDFSDTSKAAIAAGSRHGASPSSNSNVGNFTMNHVTFTNVESAFEHGSGAGTVVSISEFSVSDAGHSCFNFAEDSEVTITNGSMSDCNSDGNSDGAAIQNVAGSTAGSLYLENVSIDDALVNLIDVDFADVWINNVTATSTSSQSGIGLNATGKGVGSSLYVADLDASGYSTSNVMSLSSIVFDGVDLGSSSMTIRPGGNVNTAGPAGASASFDNYTSGALDMARMSPYMYNIDVGALTLGGNAPGAGTILGENWDTSGIAFNGCGYKVTVDGVTSDYISGSCSTAAAPNSLVMNDVDMTYTGYQNALYARNTGMSIGSASISMPSSYQNMAYAGTNGRIVLIDVDQDGTDCDGSSACDWGSSSSGDLYFGGLATVRVFKDLGSGVTENKSGHTVQATVVDNSGTALFIVGSHTTDSNGEADTWVVSKKDDGTTYDDHNLIAYGPAGQNETFTTDPWYPGSFEAGDSIALKLEPVPISLNQTTQDCQDIADNNTDAAFGWNSLTRVFTWEGKVTLTGDLVVDDCTIIMKHTFTVISDATNSPKITIQNGGTLTFTNGTTSQGNLRASSTAYPLDLDMDGGTLEFIDAKARDIKGGLVVDSGSLVVSTGSIIYGSASQPATQATVYVNGGSIDWDDSSIINNGQTGIGLEVESTGSAGADIDNIVVKNAAVGILATNAAPSVSGFTLTDNTVGIDVEGGMSLPTIYRSTSLMGVSRGWITYAIDVSDLMTGDYLQVGWNAVYGGGSAHPAYSPLYSKLYMIYDRPRLELNDGTNYWNISSSTDDGYYAGTGGGRTDYDCNRFGYSYNPWYGYSYREPTGYDWQEGTNTPSYYYPMNYWGYYSPSFYFRGWAVPPEGLNGQWGYYNVCAHYSYYTYIPTGSDARFVMPIVDISDASITGATLYVDVLHNYANNYQDRMEIVARSSNDPSDMGNWIREMGTASFSSGSISGADTGVEIGGNFAAGTFSDITVSNPTDAAFDIVGTASTTVDGLDVTGGSYGILMSQGASGTADMSNVDISGTSTAGLYYLKDMKGVISGDIHNNTGAAIKFGSATAEDRTYTGLNLANNGVGVETAGSGELTIKYSDFANTKDIVVSGGTTVDFIEGTIDTNTVDVSGSGVVNRLREVNITVMADNNAVSGANVVLTSASGQTSGSAVSDTNGVAAEITFSTQYVDETGVHVVPLSGYEAVTVAQVGTYSSSGGTHTGDFRYKFDSMVLNDAPGNEHEMTLTDSVDSRICYSYSSSAYDYVARCAGSLSTRSSRTLTSGIVEYGYYGATPSGSQNSGNGLNDQVVMVDTPIWYIDGNTKTTTNDSTFLITATYDYYDGMQLWSTYPYGAVLYSNNSTWLGLANFDDTQYGFQIGYFNWNDVVPFIHNSTMTNVLSIVTEPGPYTWIKTPHLDIQNNVITHLGSTYEGGTSFSYNSMCLISSTGAISNEYTIIRNNILNDCPVGTFIKRQGYYFYYTSSQWGADDAIIEGNTYNNVAGIGIWFYLSSYAEDVVVSDNTFTGTTSPYYGVYVQDRRTTGLEISDNEFYNPQEPIYIRGGLDWEITDNVIYGDGDASHAGIYVLNGDGIIDGNTLVDADGGILIDGIRYGYTVNVSNNDISQSTGRTAPTAVGIWAEDCGSSLVYSEANSISVMENGIVTDGCDLVDTGSDLTAVAGSGGKLWTVGVNAAAYSPDNISISTGDTIRWRANEYYNNSGVSEQHDVVSNDSLFDSGLMNLGSTFTYTFINEGTYEYHCSVHPWMYASVVVTNASSGAYDSVGINIAGSNDEVTLDGTEASGFSTTVSQEGGMLTIEGDAILSGNSYGVFAEDTEVIVDGAHLISGANGSALFLTGTSSLDATDLDTSGKYGLNSDGVDFRWNGGDSDADTALIVDGGAEGSVENVTWADAATQIDARDYTTVTSVGNTVDASKLLLASTAVIHEGNLLHLDITHKSNEPTDVGLMIQSTDGEQAAYVSPAYRQAFVSADGDTSEWVNNELNPSDDAMPGVMSSDGAGEDFLTTWDANYLHLALTGVDMGTADLQIYIDSSSGGDTTGQSWYVSHSLPFAADYVFWAEDGNTGNSGLKVNGFSGWTDVTSSCSGLQSFIGYSANTNTEVSIPWDCIGEPSDTVRLIVIVQDESTGAIESVHPDQTVATGATGQTFSEELTLMLGHSDLADGDSLQNHLLIYRSYVGSNTPTDAKEYDISVKVDAVCEEDWATVEDVSMATNVNLPIDIKRACPVITNLIDITVDEDSGLYTLTLTDKADDVQDEELDLTWSVSDDTDPTNSPSMLLDSVLSGQDLLITPDNDQFGTYTFHFEVEDSHGLTDTETIVFTVVNVNDAPIICNTERSDCMPVFADDGAGNLNVLDEGFGSVSKVLGSAANATGSYVIDMASNDMANEQPQVYTWGASIKADENISVDAYWVQKKYDTVAAMFAEVGAVMTAAGGWNDIAMSGNPDSITPNGTYVLPTLNDVSILTYLLAQNGCGSVWYQEYMDTSGNKVTAVRSDDGCDSTIDTTGKVYSGLNYSDFWMEAYGVDTEANWDSWNTVFPDGFSTTSGYNPCPPYTVSVINNELTITENQDWEKGGDCTIVLTLNDDGGYCQNTYLGRTTDVRASCVSYTWLIDYPVNHPVYGPITVTGCYNLYLGLASFVPEYYPNGQPTGMTQTICQAYAWVDENTAADDYEVTFSVTPVNDAPEVVDWNANSASDDYAVIMDGNGDVPNFPWKVTLTEDDESVDNLTYDLSMMKHDNDHEDEDLVWSIVKADTCDYENYFSATINGDDIVFDLIKDATTNAPEWEVDYLNNGGKHQKVPLSGEFCPITLYLHDTADAPDYIPNYDMPTANYQQGEDSVTLYIRVDNVAENVPDYYLSSTSGFDFNEVSNIMPKTFVPTTVTIGHGGDEGPYNYDHMLEVTFHSDGYNSDDPDGEDYVTLGTQYVTPPAYGEELEVTDFVYITATTSRIWVEVDVLTCIAESCDMSASPADRFFGYSFPFAHACIDSNGVQQDAWSCPGEIGSSSVDAEGNPSAVTLNNKRRPMLEDQDWCNNLMSTDDNGSDCAQPRTFGKTTVATGQDLPTVVRLIGIADVPSFAPSIIAISAAGLFVSALVLQSRREEEEEALEEMTLEDDEQAVSPVIATILMVAITVVLSGVIYVWASSLADTSAKGVPRITFTLDSSQALGGDASFHRITVTGSQVELATQAIQVLLEYTDSTGEAKSELFNLADTTVYGFYPGNSETLVTFTDAVGTQNGATKSSFDTGDTIYIRTVTADGEPMTNLYVSISYNPATGVGGSVLRTWSGL